MPEMKEFEKCKVDPRQIGPTFLTERAGNRFQLRLVSATVGRGRLAKVTFLD
jgi:hypothetical protein